MFLDYTTATSQQDTSELDDKLQRENQGQENMKTLPDIIKKRNANIERNDARMKQLQIQYQLKVDAGEYINCHNNFVLTFLNKFLLRQFVFIM